MYQSGKRYTGISEALGLQQTTVKTQIIPKGKGVGGGIDGRVPK